MGQCFAQQRKMSKLKYSHASLEAYGAVIYSRCFSESGNITTSLIACKSGVAPIKSTAILQLELLGNLLLAWLMKNVKRPFQILGQTVITYFWTDSKVTSNWIFVDSKIFEVFVQNRLKEIRSISKSQVFTRPVVSQFLDLRGNLENVKEKLTRRTCFSREKKRLAACIYQAKFCLGAILWSQRNLCVIFTRNRY